MQQSIYETFQAILFLEMPKNDAGNIIVFDREIKGWSLGDRRLKPATPAIVIYGSSLNKKEITTLTYETEHVITIKLETGNDDQAISASLLQEFERLVNEVFLEHRQIWVIDKCPICMKKTLSPQHFLIEHSDIFQSYADNAVADLEALWAETHTTTMPTIAESRKASLAFDGVLEDIKNNRPIERLNAESKRAFDFMVKNKMKPIRLLYDTKISDIKPTDNGIDKQTYHIGEITIHALEVTRIPSSGPDGVSTDAWSIR
jgi:hypothetical protein